MFRRLCIGLICAVVLGTALHAQARRADEVWIQIAAYRTLDEALREVRDYAARVDNVYGFGLGGDWYAVAAGPYDEPTGATELSRLRAQGAIPRDAYLSDGDAYGAVFYPVGLDTPGDRLTLGAIAPAPAPAPIAPLETTLPDETEAQARASERALTPQERRDLQIALKWFGHYTAAIDGAFGSGTRAAMASFQAQIDAPTTGVLTTRQRAQLLQMHAQAMAALGLEKITDSVAGITLEAPMGLVQFDRYEAPFAHYGPRDGSGVRMVLISQPGDQGTMNGLYEILQTLADVPPTGPREKRREGFSITGIAPGFTSETRVKLEDGHIHGFMLIWPPAQDSAIARVLPEMEATLASTGTPMPLTYGFDPEAQSLDLLAGLEVRRPAYSRSGFFVDEAGAVLTTAEVATGCDRLTIDHLYDARVQAVDAGLGLALLSPVEDLAPMSVVRFAPQEGRLRARVAVAGFPFQGVLGAATLTFGTLEDVQGLDGERDLQRLALTSQPGDRGGPVFTETGAVGGLLLPPPDNGRLLPADVALARKAAAMLTFLGAQGVMPKVAPADAPALAPEDLTVLAAETTVLVSCWE